MTGLELKKSLILLAASGKLVPQNAEEGDVSDLLKVISNNRNKALSSGLVRDSKKKEPLPIKAEDIPFDIPETWSWKRLSSLCNFQAGKTPERHNENYWKNGTIPWISISDMVDGEIVSETKEKITEEAVFDSFGNNLVEPGTLLMSFKLTIGKMSFTKEKCTHNEAIISIYPYLEGEECEVFKKYLAKVLPLLSQYGDFNNAVKGKTLNASSISQILIPVPPICEQKRIINKMDDVYPLITTYSQKKKELDELNGGLKARLKKSILHEAFLGKVGTGLKGDGSASLLVDEIIKKAGKKKRKANIENYIVPDGWDVVYLGDIVDIYGGKRVPAGKKLVSNDTGHKYIRVSDMKNYSVDLSGIKYLPEDIYKEIKQYNIHCDDIYITVAGTIGRVGTIPEELDGANLTENANKLVFNVLDKEWLVYFLDSPDMQKQIYDSTKKEGQPKLAIKRIADLIIPVPPLEEQKRIVKKIKNLFVYVDKIGIEDNEKEESPKEEE